MGYRATWATGLHGLQGYIGNMGNRATWATGLHGQQGNIGYKATWATGQYGQQGEMRKQANRLIVFKTLFFSYFLCFNFPHLCLSLPLFIFTFNDSIFIILSYSVRTILNIDIRFISQHFSVSWLG